MFPVYEYMRQDGLGLAALVRSGGVSATELLETAISGIEALNPALNAVIRTRFERAHAEASQVDLAAPFAGVPFLVKDLLGTLAGEPTANGTRLLANVPMPHDSELVGRFRAAGVVIIGRTNTPEFGLTPYTEPLLYGPGDNHPTTTTTIHPSCPEAATRPKSAVRVHDQEDFDFVERQICSELEQMRHAGHAAATSPIAPASISNDNHRSGATDMTH